MGAHQMGRGLRRAVLPPDRVTAPGVVTDSLIEARAAAVRARRHRLALEQIAKLEAVFDEPLDAARAAVRIATEALK